MKPEAVMITWVDATSHDEWESYEEAKDLMPHEIHTVGFLIDAKPEYYILAMNHDPEREAVSQTIAIPRSWVKMIKFV